jgi:hypothetical protein
MILSISTSSSGSAGDHLSEPRADLQMLKVIKLPGLSERSEPLAPSVSTRIELGC